MKTAFYFFFIVYFFTGILYPVAGQQTRVALVKEQLKSSNGVLYQENDFTYNRFGQDSVLVSRYFDGYGETTMQVKQDYYFHDQLLDSVWYYDYNFADSAYAYSSKSVYFYNAGSLLDSIIFFDYDTTSQSWFPSLKYFYAYDSDGNVITDALYYFSNADWHPWDRFLYDYDNLNRVTVLLYQYYDTGSQNFVDFQRIMYSYPALDTVNEMVQFYHDDVWENDSRKINVFTAFHKYSVRIVQKWDSSTGTYENRVKFDYIYGNQHELQRKTRSSWTGSDWNQPGIEKELYHTTSIDSTQLIVSQYFDNEWEENKYYYFSHQLDSLRTGYGTHTYYYTLLPVLNSSAIRTETWHLYPNPAHDKLYVDGETEKARILVLFDHTGKMVWKTPVTPIINLPKLRKGSYWYLLESRDGHRQSGRLLIK